MTGSRRGCLVYDPDPLNPYGRELARLLSSLAPTTLYTTTAAEWTPSGVRTRRVLSSNRHRDHLAGAVLLRLTGCLLAVASSVVRRRLLVVAWPRDAWDGFVFTMAARAGLPVVVVDHNPIPERRRTGRAGRTDAALMSAAAAVVVHSESLAAAARTCKNRVVVAAHPAYFGWWNRFRGVREIRGSRRVLFLGALRGDKGADDLAAVVAHMSVREPVTLVLAGRGELPVSLNAAADAVAELERMGDAGGCTDEEIASALASADVLVAPYRGATQSGSIILALTAGLPVVAYRSGAIPELIGDDFTTAVGDVEALAACALRAMSVGEQTARLTAQDLDQRARDDWRAIVAPYIGPTRHE